MKYDHLRIYPVKIPISDYPNFSDRLNLALEIRHVTASDLAKRLFLSPSTISGYRCGIRLPNCALLCKIAQELEVSTDYLLGLDDCIFLSREERNSYLFTKN